MPVVVNNNQDEISHLFDRIYVVSLPASSDRRSYIAAHLENWGINEYEYHDACGPDHPNVSSAQQRGLVHQYPPCFRCGQMSCGRDDCNNVLIPEQVATFLTYLNLWKKIASRSERALVLEDDVHLHDHWPMVLKFIRKEVEAGRLSFDAAQPKLMRLGWALNSEHNSNLLPQLSDEVRMSNPCHALTSAYAENMLKRFTRIDTTADIFLHRLAPKENEAITVFPPIASELSWSEGRFPSLIHPKRVRAEYLAKQGLFAEAEEASLEAEFHAKETAHRVDQT